MYLIVLRVLAISALAISCIALVSCGVSPAPPLRPTPSATALSLSSPNPAPTIAVPTRIAVPMVTIAPDLAARPSILTMANFRFSPSTLKGRAGQPIRLSLENTDGSIRHAFAIDNTDVEVVLSPGYSQRLDFVISKPGTYVFACNLNEEGDHRAAGMVGTLLVDPAP